jgi:hypothetical protein
VIPDKVMESSKNGSTDGSVASPDPHGLIDEMSNWWIRQGGQLQKGRELMFHWDGRSVFRTNWDYQTPPCVMVASKKHKEAFRWSFGKHGLEETGEYELKVELHSLRSLGDLKRAVISAMKQVGDLPPNWPETGRE